MCGDEYYHVFVISYFSSIPEKPEVTAPLSALCSSVFTYKRLKSQFPKYSDMILLFSNPGPGCVHSDLIQMGQLGNSDRGPGSSGDVSLCCRGGNPTNGFDCFSLVVTPLAFHWCIIHMQPSWNYISSRILHWYFICTFSFYCSTLDIDISDIICFLTVKKKQY